MPRGRKPTRVQDMSEEQYQKWHYLECHLRIFDIEEYNRIKDMEEAKKQRRKALAKKRKLESERG